MNKAVKKLIKSSLNRLGYSVSKLPCSRQGHNYPYVRHCEYRGLEFNFWIANELAQAWYHQADIILSTSETRALESLVCPGDRVLELGCHHGAYTILLCHLVGDSGFVCALEAQPDNAMIAQSQLVLNDVANRSTVLHRAAAATKGTLNMSSADGSNLHAVHSKHERTVKVDCVTGDSLSQRYGPFDCIKVDVEGFELDVLSGCRGILESTPKLAIELHLELMAHYGTKVDDIFNLIDVGRYRGYMIAAPEYKIVEFQPLDLPKAATINVFLSHT